MTKARTIAGMGWTFLENFGNKFVQFGVGILMARMLTPVEYGMVGMATVFLALSSVVTDSGFSQALIRKPDCSREDLETTLVFNLAVAATMYVLVFLAAPWIAIFFDQPLLTGLVRFTGLIIMINSTTIAQRAILARRMDFRTQAFASVIATFVSSAVALAMAWQGFGVWALVFRMLVESVIVSVLLWRGSDTEIRLRFHVESFRTLFAFGSRMMASGIIHHLYMEVYKVVIAKGFSMRDLGFYTRASQFSDIPSEGFSEIIERVSLPALAQVDPARLKEAFRKLITTVTFLVFTLMLGMAAVADNLVLVLLGSAWAPTGSYLRLLCLATMLYPLHSLNLQILTVRGLSGVFLKLEVYKKFLVVPTILIGLKWGISAMLWAMVAESIVAFFMNSSHSGRLIEYPTTSQILDILPGTAIAASMATAVFGIGQILPEAHPAALIAQIAFGAAFIVAVSESIRFAPYLEIKDAARTLVLNKLRGGARP